MEDPLEAPPPAEEIDGPEEPSRSRGLEGSAAQPPTSADDGLLLVELAGIDELLRDRAAAWKELVRRLEGLRQEIAVASAQVQRSRSLVRQKPRDDDADQGARLSAPARDEARAGRLTLEFEAALRDTEQRRVGLHAEMDDLRRRRAARLRQLPASISRAYRSLTDGGRTPAIAAVAKGACIGCGAPLPDVVIEALGQGAVVACARCQRLLHLAKPAE